MRTITLAIAGLLLFSGCSSDPKPIEPKKRSPSPSATVPEKPSVISKDTADGAANFVKYWVDVSNYAAATGDVNELKRISNKKCAGCSAYIDLYAKTYAAGGFFRGSPWQISQVKVRRGSKESLISAHVEAEEGTYKTSRNSKLKKGNAEDSDLIFGARFTGRTWVMTQMGLASELTE